MNALHILCSRTYLLLGGGLERSPSLKETLSDVFKGFQMYVNVSASHGGRNGGGEWCGAKLSSFESRLVYFKT